MKKSTIKPGPSANPMREDRSKASSPLYTCPAKMTVKAKVSGSGKGR